MDEPSLLPGGPGMHGGQHPPGLGPTYHYSSSGGMGGGPYGQKMMGLGGQGMGGISGLGPGQAQQMVQWITHFVRQKGGVITAANLGSALARLHPDFYGLIKASHGGLTAFLADYPERFSFANDPPFNHVFLARELHHGPGSSSSSSGGPPDHFRGGPSHQQPPQGPSPSPPGFPLKSPQGPLSSYALSGAPPTAPRLVRPVPTASSGSSLTLPPNGLTRSRSLSDPRSGSSSMMTPPPQQLVLPMSLKYGPPPPSPPHSHSHSHSLGLPGGGPGSSSSSAGMGMGMGLPTWPLDQHLETEASGP